MLYLNAKDIETVIDYKEMINVIEQAIKVYESNEFIMPDRISVMKDNETYLYMPCFTDDVKGTKVLTLFPDNPKINMPVIQGVMLLNDVKTGKVNCILDGAAVTAFRTGAVGAAGIKYTTPKDAHCLGIVGCGVQAFFQAIYASHIRDIKKVYLYDYSHENAKQLKEKLSNVLVDAEITVCNDARELVSNSEIIITTTTANQPVLPDDANLLNGKHFIGIGSYKPTMREYPKSLFSVLDEVYIDVDFAKEESGDLSIPIEQGLISEDNIYTLGKVLSGKEVDTNKTTFYKSVGMGIFDILIADLIAKKATQQNIGQIIVD